MSDFLQCADVNIRLHLLARDGKRDSSEYEAICEEMAVLWYNLAEEERARLDTQAVLLNEIEDYLQEKQEIP